jgi:hypothetical protein
MPFFTFNIFQTLIGSDPLQPPASLLDFYPLADLCNVILCGLNELRLLAPTSLAPEVVGRIQVGYLLSVCVCVCVKPQFYIFLKKKINGTVHF